MKKLIYGSLINALLVLSSPIALASTYTCSGQSFVRKWYPDSQGEELIEVVFDSSNLVLKSFKANGVDRFDREWPLKESTVMPGWLGFHYEWSRHGGGGNYLLLFKLDEDTKEMLLELKFGSSSDIAYYSNLEMQPLTCVAGVNGGVSND